MKQYPPALVGIYLGLTITAWLVGLVATIVLNSHPSDWERVWWLQVSWLAVAVILLPWLLRYSRQVGALGLALALILFASSHLVGLLFAGAVLYLGFRKRPTIVLGPPGKLVASQDFTQAEKRVLRATAAGAVALPLMWLTLSYQAHQRAWVPPEALISGPAVEEPTPAPSSK
jgi:hypothetical protein